MSRSTLKDKSQEQEEICSSAAPETCNGCYRWGQWQEKCSYFWSKKKECGSKVNDYEEMITLDQLRRR